MRVPYSQCSTGATRVGATHAKSSNAVATTSTPTRLARKSASCTQRRIYDYHGLHERRTRQGHTLANSIAAGSACMKHPGQFTWNVSTITALYDLHSQLGRQTGNWEHSQWHTATRAGSRHCSYEMRAHAREVWLPLHPLCHIQNKLAWVISLRRSTAQ